MADKAEKVIKEFMDFSIIPHGSGNEKAVGEYLMNWAKVRGIKCEKDSYGNVIMEKGGSAGYENSPLVILQSHMDMVCVAASDKEYNPETDPIEIYRDGDFLKAKGTSLGADDGAGVAMMLYILSEDSLKHPPIRAIFTVEEETSMKGASNLDVKYLDAKYLLNLDWEEKASISSSCANTVSLDFTSDVEKKENKKPCYEISVMHLLGGHSGCDINLPRANAIKLLAELLYDMDLELASFNAGRVPNAICAEASCVIATDEIEKVKAKIELFKGEILKEYPNEKDISITISPKPCQSVLAEKDRKKLLSFLVSVHSGVFYMSKYTPDFVETSQNIGIVRVGDKIEIQILARSSSKFHSEERKRAAKALSDIYGYTLSIPSENPIWEEKDEGELIRIMKRAYKDVTKNELTVIGVHAGLECAFFSSVKPDLEMVSCGPQLYDVHSPKERWEVSSLEETVDFIVRALELMN